MIWVVTDHKKTRDSLVPLIANKGYEVADIDCGDEVIKRVRFQKPRLAIIDCGIPDSFEMLAAIRSPLNHRIPVVMFSTADEDLKDKALLKGADSYVGKGSLDWLELLTEIVRIAGPPK